MKKFLKHACLTALALAYGVCLAEQATVAVDFEKEDALAAWEMTDPDAWTLQKTDKGQSLALVKRSKKYKPKVRSPHNIAWLTTESYGSFELKLKARSTIADYGHRDLCFFFGRQDASNFYYAHLGKKTDPHCNQVFLVADKPRKAISLETTTGTHWKDDQWHDIMIRRDIDTGDILIYFDDMDKPIMKAKDTTHGAGWIGLGSFDDTGEFDDIEIGAWKADK